MAEGLAGQPYDARNPVPKILHLTSEGNDIRIELPTQLQRALSRVRKHHAGGGADKQPHPRLRSSSEIRRLRADWAICSSSAARLMEPSRATERKS